MNPPIENDEGVCKWSMYNNTITTVIPMEAAVKDNARIVEGELKLPSFSPEKATVSLHLETR